jgi:prepilin peptidase CpaA
MSGRIDVLFVGISALSLAAAATDLIWGRIFNWLTGGALLLGLALSAWTGGWHGLGESVLAALLGLILFGWMFWLGFMAGGDVKLLMALGAWGGLRFVEEVAVLSIIVGGVLAALLLLPKGRLRSLGHRLFVFFRSIAIPELEVESLKIDRKLTMPFGVPIAVAAVWAAAAHPLVAWGLPLWP